MPKKTNEFQKVILAVKSALADGAKVTESKLLLDKDTGTPREVDVCIEGKMAGEDVTFCIECRAHKRVQDVLWVEQAKAKYDCLPVNGVILASKTGFSKEAKDKAKHFGIKLITFEELDTADFEEILGKGNTLGMKSVTLEVKKVVVDLEPHEKFPQENRIQVVPDQSVFDETGEQVGQIGALSSAMINSPIIRDQILKEGKEDTKWFEIPLEVEKDERIPPFFLQKIEPITLRKVIKVTVSGTCEIKIDQFGLKYGKVDGVTVAYGKTKIMEHETYVVATKDSNGKSKLNILMNRPKEKKTKTKKVTAKKTKAKKKNPKKIKKSKK